MTDLLEQVLRRDRLQHVPLARLLDLAAQQQLVQHEERLLKVEDNVQLAYLPGTRANGKQREYAKFVEYFPSQADASVQS